MKYKLYTTAERPDLVTSGDEIVVANWPEFMLHDEIASEYFPKLYKEFPEFQFWLIDESNDNKIVGIGNSIPLFFDGDLKDLPEKGWDYALQKGFEDKENGVKPNILCALAITMNPEYKEKGISHQMVKAIMELGRRGKFNRLILPVRPSEKHKYPLISMDEYLKNNIREDNFSTDPWVRVHQRLGGKIIKPCNEAMLIEGSVKDWENWAKMEFSISGEYVVPFALATVKIDIEKDLGTYIEPNIWMVHELGYHIV
ncbi:MAG: GNAT family N-acetyltransferase [Candidatus Delongbacteria bacterium]|nr:GNAT family N-acetyltransferase [Candidatus Delongbacteria bacterium]